MIRAVDSKRLDLSDDEFNYYNKLVEKFGEKDFKGLFTSDKNGQITSISPPLDKQISMGVMFFILNVMMNQRLRAIALMAEKKAEKNVALEKVVSTMERRLTELEARIGKDQVGE